MYAAGLFRAGTTLLSQLLDLDPGARSLLGWESQDSVPPPTPENHRTGERVEQARERMEMMDLLCPALPAIHHEEPDGPIECVTLLSQDFKSPSMRLRPSIPTPASCTSSTAAAIGEHLTAHPKGRFGAHRYDLADFGLDEAELRSTFAAYAERYEVAEER